MSETPPAGPAPADEYVLRASARAFERDRYLSALLAPSRLRADLLALAAFAGEIARIPAYVSEPMMGEIRLQWWRDAIEAGPGTGSGHPVADAVRAAAERHGLPRGLLIGFIDAHAAGLQDDPPADNQALKAHLAKTEGALFELALGVLGPREEPALAAAALAGQSYGIARMLMELPALWAQGRTLLPANRLAEAGITLRELKSGLPPARLEPILASLEREARSQRAEAARLARQLRRAQHVALLPVALVEPYLQAFEKPGRDVLREVADIAPIRRLWCLLRAYVTGRL